MAKQKAKSNKRKFRIFGVISLASMLCILYFLVFVGVEVYNIYDLQNQQTELKEEYKNLKKEAEKLQIEINELNDPEYLAKYARENYSYSKEGEYIIKLKDSDKKIKNINKSINKNYIIVGISIFGFILFVCFLFKIKR